MTTPPSMFGNARLQRAIDRCAASFDADDNAAVVAHVDDEEGASLSLLVKINDQWQFRTVLLKRFDEPFRWGADVIWHGKVF